MNELINIRREQLGDAEQIRNVNAQAFESSGEADLVDELRRTCGDSISLVATDLEEVVGHILFTPVVIDSVERQSAGMGLAPMAVVPDRQRQGIGSRLVEAGLKLLRDAGQPFVVVLGHPDYYPRFGFAPASRIGVSCEFEVPDEMFMILTFAYAPPDNLSGVAKYRPEFDRWK